MKVLHITPAFEPAWHMGGVVRSLGLLCKGLAQQGIDVTVFTTNSGGDRWMSVPTDKIVEVEGVKVNYFKTDITYKFGFSRSLRAACIGKIKDFDIVHITSLWWYPEIPAAWQAKKQEVPYIINTTGGLIKYSLSQKWIKKHVYLSLIEKRILNNAAAIRFTAELEREQTAYLKLRAPSFIVPNGFNINEFNKLPDKNYSKEYFDFPQNVKILIYLGRLHARKGLDVLITALSKVQKEFPNLFLILAGPDDGFEIHLRNLSAKLGISSKVKFLGYIPPEKRNLLLRASDLLILATHPGENFGNAAVEAMFAGIPVLVSENVGICREVMTDGAGAVIELNEDAMVNALRRLLSNPKNLTRMGEAASVSARKRYDLHVVAKRMVTAYEDILTGRRSPGLSWANGIT